MADPLIVELDAARVALLEVLGPVPKRRARHEIAADGCRPWELLAIRRKHEPRVAAALERYQTAMRALLDQHSLDIVRIARSWMRSKGVRSRSGPVCADSVSLLEVESEAWVTARWAAPIYAEKRRSCSFPAWLFGQIYTALDEFIRARGVPVELPEHSSVCVGRASLNASNQDELTQPLSPQRPKDECRR